MSKSLAELRASSQIGLPERTYMLCMASSLVAETQALYSQLIDAESDDEDEAVTPPRRLGEKAPAEAIRAKLAEVKHAMAEHTGRLRLRAYRSGAWLDWVDEHPAREGNERDVKYAFGLCNADALLANLSNFTVSWNDEPLTPDDWRFIADTAAPSDLRNICQVVVAMHETAVDVPKLLSGLLENPAAETD